MGKVLVFGGLTQLGQPMIEHLLNNGQEVVAVRAASAEEDIEMFFGRHALFTAIDHEDWRDDLKDVDVLLCLDTTTFISGQECNGVLPEIMGDRIRTCLDGGELLKKVIIASHIDIYGQAEGTIDEQTPASPVTERGYRVDTIERAVIEALLSNKERARTIQAFFCRLPHINIEETHPEGESLPLDSVAKGVCAFVYTEHSPGIEVVQLTSGQKVIKDGLVVNYRNDKAKHMIDFNPNQKH